MLASRDITKTDIYIIRIYNFDQFGWHHEFLCFWFVTLRDKLYKRLHNIKCNVRLSTGWSKYYSTQYGRSHMHVRWSRCFRCFQIIENSVNAINLKYQSYFRIIKPTPIFQLDMQNRPNHSRPASYLLFLPSSIKSLANGYF